MLCDLCPTAFHCECLGFKKPPTAKTWFCPHHSCIQCSRKSIAAGLLFRCEMCPNAYCEDCVPAEMVVLGPSKRFEQLGYRLPQSACFVHCSDKCVAFAVKAQELQQYQDVHGSDAFPDWWVGREEDDEAEAEESGDDRHSKKKGKKRGKGRKKRTRRRNIFDENSSEEEIVSDEVDSESETAPKELDGKHNRMARALQACSLPDIARRLSRDADGFCRFVDLEEIPCFVHRWKKAVPSAQGLLLKLVETAEPHLIVLRSRGQSGLDPGGEGTQSGAHVDPSSALLSSGPSTEEEVFEVVKKYSGTPFGISSLEEATKIFLSLMSVLTSARKFDLINLANLLGMAISVQPFNFSKKDLETNHRKSLMPEPKFK